MELWGDLAGGVVVGGLEVCRRNLDRRALLTDKSAGEVFLKLKPRLRTGLSFSRRFIRMGAHIRAVKIIKYVHTYLTSM